MRPDTICQLTPMLLRNDRSLVDLTPITIFGVTDDETFSGIRCPLCAWRPSASSLWRCVCIGTPEPFFAACGTEWNTFSTRGQCPGCGHQWRWTACLRCHASSLHEDWYEQKDGQRP